MGVWLHGFIEVLFRLAYAAGVIANIAGLLRQQHYLRWAGLLGSTGCAILLLFFWILTRKTTNYRAALYTCLGLTAVLLGNLTLAEPLQDFLDFAGFLLHLCGVFCLLLAFSSPTRVPTRARSIGGAIVTSTQAGKPVFVPLSFRGLRFLTPFLCGLGLMLSWPLVLAPNSDVDSYPIFVAACCLVAVQALMVWRALARIGYGREGSKKSQLATKAATRRNNNQGTPDAAPAPQQQASSASSMLLALPLESSTSQWCGAFGAIFLSVAILALGYDRLVLDDDPDADQESTYLRMAFTAAYCLAFWVGQTLLVCAVPFYPLPSPRSASSSSSSSGAFYSASAPSSPTSIRAASALPPGSSGDTHTGFFFDLADPAITPPPLASVATPSPSSSSAAGGVASSPGLALLSGGAAAMPPSLLGSSSAPCRVAILIPDSTASFDIAEVAVTWWTLTKRGHHVSFVTRDGAPGVRARLGLLPTPYPPSLFGYLPMAGAATEELRAASDKLQGEVVAAALRGTANASAPPSVARRGKRGATDDEDDEREAVADGSRRLAEMDAAAGSSIRNSRCGCCCDVFSWMCRVCFGACLFGAPAACLSIIFCVDFCRDGSSSDGRGTCCGPQGGSSRGGGSSKSGGASGNSGWSWRKGGYSFLDEEQEGTDASAGASSYSSLSSSNGAASGGSTIDPSSASGVFAPSPLIIHLYEAMLRSKAFRNPLAWSQRAAAVASSVATAAAAASQHASASSAMAARGRRNSVGNTGAASGAGSFVRSVHFFGLSHRLGLGSNGTREHYGGGASGSPPSGSLARFFASCYCPRSCSWFSSSSSGASLLSSATFLSRLGPGDDDDGSSYFDATTGATGAASSSAGAASGLGAGVVVDRSMLWSPEGFDALVVVGAYPSKCHDAAPWDTDRDLRAALVKHIGTGKPIACFGNAVLPLTRPAVSGEGASESKPPIVLLGSISRAALGVGPHGDRDHGDGKSDGGSSVTGGLLGDTAPILLTTQPKEAEDMHLWLAALFACDWSLCAAERAKRVSPGSAPTAALAAYESVEDEVSASIRVVNRRRGLTSRASAVLGLPSLAGGINGGCCGCFWAVLYYFFCSILLRCEVPILRRSDPFAGAGETLVVETEQLLTAQGGADAFVLARRLMDKLERTTQRGF